MLKHQLMSLVSLGCTLAVLGCAAEEPSTTKVPADNGSPDDGSPDDGSPDDGSPDNGSPDNGSPDNGSNVGLTPSAFEFTNGLSPSCFWDYGVQGYLRTMGNVALTPNAKLPGIPNNVSSLCYDAIKYAVQCGLGSDVSVMNPKNGASYTGVVGLAPDWKTRALNSDERRWVTACMVQRLNVLGQTVPIVLEGNRSPLYEDTSIDAKYPYEEATAFGDLFSSTVNLAVLLPVTPAFTAYVCGEQEVTNSCLNVANLLQARLCGTVSLLCGMQYIGQCADVCTTVDGAYWDCPVPGSQDRFTQTVRVQSQANFCL